MADCIDKESWCKDGYHGKKFHHKNVTSKRCPGCGDRNPDFIDDDKDSLSDADKELEEPRRPLKSKP
jgi:Zn finger protein HypA/HybF involved in hydrogenase expression